MIHHFYVGHFEKADGVMRLQKRRDGAPPRPVVARRLDMAAIQELLEEKGVAGMNVPDDWQLGIDDEGFLVCDAYTRSRDAIDFIRRLIAKTGCEVLYDGMLAISADGLTAWPPIKLPVTAAP